LAASKSNDSEQEALPFRVMWLCSYIGISTLGNTTDAVQPFSLFANNENSHPNCLQISFTKSKPKPYPSFSLVLSSKPIPVSAISIF